MKRAIAIKEVEELEQSARAEEVSRSESPGQAVIPQPPPYPAASRLFIRRLLWILYGVPLVTLVTLAFPAEFSLLGPVAVIDFAISLPAHVALLAYAWDKRLLVRRFWKAYAFIFIAWQVVFNAALAPHVTQRPYNPAGLATEVLLLPMYFALFRYAFGRWGTVD